MGPIIDTLTWLRFLAVGQYPDVPADDRAVQLASLRNLNFIDADDRLTATGRQIVDGAT